jgi:hypothetical protein
VSNELSTAWHRRCAPLIYLVVALMMSLMAAAASDARASAKKSVWGPPYASGASDFPRYRDLGAGIYQDQLRWSDIALSRPDNPTDPSDPAYQWPTDVTRAVAEARRYRMRVALMLIGSPPWANGGQDWNWAPTLPSDFADFAYAASRRFPSVDFWMVWGEPSRGPNFQPLTPAPPERRLTAAQASAPRSYARMLDAAYGSLKRADRRDTVVGGMTYSGGDISSWQWIANMRLPNGRPPRLDTYGHNPFSLRPPDLRNPPSCCGIADFSDLGRLSTAVDRNLSPTRRGGRRRQIPLFLSEFTLPTDVDREFNFHVDRTTQASWIRQALRIVRRWPRIQAFGWIHLYDEAPRPDGQPVSTGGLLDYRGVPKPGYYAFKAG